MKRLALAAGIALALSTIGAGPAVGHSTGITEILAAEQAMQPAGDDGPSTSDAFATTSDRPATSEEEAADPAPEEDPAAADTADSAAKDAEAAEPIDAIFSLAKTKMTAGEIADPAQGIRFTIDPLQVGDIVTGEPGDDTSTTVKDDGIFIGTILGNTELQAGDTIEVTVTVKRDGQKPKVFNGSVEVVGPDGENHDAELTVSPKTQKLDRFLNDGVDITAASCVLDEPVNFSVTRPDDPDTVLWEDTQTAAVKGAAGVSTFIPGTGGDRWTGEFVVTVSCGDTAAETTFIVTDSAGDDAQVTNVDLTVTPKAQELQKFFTSGISITLVSCVVDEDVKFRVSTEHDPDTAVWEETQKAGEDAAGHASFVPDQDSGQGWIGKYLVRAACGDHETEATFTVTADDSVTDSTPIIDPTLTIDEQSLSGKDFINRDKGVTMTVTECKPGNDVQFQVWGFEPNVKLYDRTVEANQNGGASVQVYGVEDSPEAYVGTYRVVAVCLEQVMNGEFVVSSGGGSADDSDGGADDTDTTGSMPRTGAEITGLGAGAVLIMAGAATLIFARRRAQLGS